MKKVHSKTVKTSITGWIPKRESLKETLQNGGVIMKRRLPGLSFCVDSKKDILKVGGSKDKIQKVVLTATLTITRKVV